MKSNSPYNTPTAAKKTELHRLSGGTHYEDFRHPNMMSVISTNMGPGGGLDNSTYVEDNPSCFSYLIELDERILRPMLIYKYKKNKHKPEINFDQVLL
jgi:hypothetical protein